MKRYILFKKKLSKMKMSYISMEKELGYERQFYSEELQKSDWEYLKKASELFLIHAYSHLFGLLKFETDTTRVRVLGDDQDTTRYQQFNLNLAVGLELLLKSILLKKGIKINTPNKKGTKNTFDLEHTISLNNIINKHLRSVFPNLIDDTVREIQDTLRLINLRRNNVAHCSKRSYDSYVYEHRFSYVTLYIYERYFYSENQELTKLLLKSIERSKVTQVSDFKPLKVKPRSLREGKSI